MSYGKQVTAEMNHVNCTGSKICVGVRKLYHLKKFFRTHRLVGPSVGESSQQSRQIAPARCQPGVGPGGLCVTTWVKKIWCQSYLSIYLSINFSQAIYLSSYLARYLSLSIYLSHTQRSRRFEIKCYCYFTRDMRQ